MMLQGWRWYGPNDPVIAGRYPSGRGDRYRHRAASGADRRGLDARGGRGAQGDDREHAARPLAADLVGGGMHSGAGRRQAARRQGDPLDRGVDREPGGGGAAGIKIICYNFMPVVDWTRTDLEWSCRTAPRALRFDRTASRLSTSTSRAAGRAARNIRRRVQARARKALRRDEPGRDR